MASLGTPLTAILVGVVVAVLSVSAQTPASAPPGSPSMRNAKQVEDSLATLHELRRLRERFLTRLGLRTRAPAVGEVAFMDFACEIQVVAYCFGPRNGDIPLGAYGMFQVGSSFSDRSVIRQSVNDLRSMTRDFLVDLDRLGARIPADRWVAGTRVYVLIERGDLVGANQSARRCRSDPWWCSALAGHTFTLASNYSAADSAFAIAMARMPLELRCEWNDVALLLDDDERDRFSGLPCAERDAIAERLWWLADPLYVMPGNERRTAHYSRRVFDRLAQDWHDRPPAMERSPCAAQMREQMRGRMGSTGPFTRRPVPRATIDDEGRYHLNRIRFKAVAHHQMVMRMGIPDYSFMEAWTQCGVGLPRTLFQFAGHRYHFVPRLEAAMDPLRAQSDDWDLPARYPSEMYAASFGRIVPLPHQAAYFERGDSALLVAVADAGGDSLIARTTLAVTALVLAQDQLTPPRIVRSAPEHRHSYSVLMAPDSQLMSLELLSRGAGAARARYAIGPPPMPEQRVTMSDLLVLDSATPLPSDLDAATARAATSMVVERDALGLFWEAYGITGDDTLTMVLSAVERPPSALGRFGAMIGVTSGQDSAAVRWTETGARAANGVMGQSIALDLSALDRGEYRLRLEITVRGQVPVAVTREIEVVR